jgi:hypothetical protein
MLNIVKKINGNTGYKSHSYNYNPILPKVGVGLAHYQHQSFARQSKEAHLNSQCLKKRGKGNIRFTLGFIG